VLGRAKRFAGHEDTPLSPRGRAQVRRLRARFLRLAPEVVFSSDLSRCLETASLLAPRCPVEASDRLRELDFGDWDGESARSCRRRDKKLFDRWMRRPWSTSPPGGESLRELWTRVRRFVASVVERFPNRTLAIISHAGPIRTLLAPAPEQFWTMDVPPAALFRIEWGPEGRCFGD